MRPTYFPWWFKPLGAVIAILGAVLIYLDSAEENKLAIGRSVPSWVIALHFGIGISFWMYARRRDE